MHRTLSRIVAAAVMLAFTACAVAKEDVKLTPEQLTPGTTIDLTGPWLYKPGYTTSAGEAPEKPDATADGYVSVPVPQILNRIHWWLDDSDDFKRDEDERLKKLGFDTENAEDGWYRKWIELPESGLPAATRVFVQFDGVAMRSDVYVNGTKLGHHDGMFSRFSYDLTPHLKPGRNLLAAFVSMEKIPSTSIELGEAVTVNLTASKVLSMSKGMFGPLSPGYDNRAYDLHGIWQPVRLVITGAARIEDVWFKPTLDGASIDTEFTAADGQQVAVAHQLTDAATGEKLSSVAHVVQRRGSQMKDSIAFKDLKPKLWTPAEPHLYVLETTLYAPKNVVLDRQTRKVGFRTFEAKGNKLLLNGKPYWIRGANQLPYGKNPTDPALARKLIQHLHDANIRVTRTHCTPWNEAWLNAADEIGVGVSVEGHRPWALVGRIGPTPPDMMKHWLAEQADIIKRIRNHPSVLIHTIGNEMMLRDDDNVEKWKQLSEVTRLTRQLDPFRPIVVSSTYVRDQKQYEKLLKPNGVDDGDVDDVHNYKGWYSASPFVTDSTYATELKRRGTDQRPFIGQEQSTGYPDLDTGLPVLRYTRDLVTPQAWVGVYAYPGNDPKWFLEYNRAVTKRWAEQLRFQRGNNTAGFSLFSAECWFSHSYSADQVKPYPVVEAVKQAYSPVGLALETSRRRFYAGEAVEAGLFVTNDDDRFRDLDITLRVQLVDRETGKVLHDKTEPPGSVKYYETRHLLVQVPMPQVDKPRQALDLVLTAAADGKEVGRSVDGIEVFHRPPTTDIEVPAEIHLIGSPLTGVASTGTGSKVILAAGGTGGEQLDAILAQVQDGATAILFAPDMKQMLKRFPGDIYDDAKVAEEDFNRRVAEAKEKKQDPPRKPQAGFAYDPKRDIGEFADWTPARATKLVEGLEPMDLRWWARKDGGKTYVSTGSFRLKPDGKARELIRYIPSHSYIPAERVPWQYRTVLFELPVGSGRVWVCNLDLDASRGIDPVADLLARNILQAAADPQSTANLKGMPSHEDMLSGKLPQ